MFDFIHSEQEEGWWLDASAIIIYTNPFFMQQEQGLIISLLKAIEDVKRARYSNTINLIIGIRNNKGH